MAETRPHIWNLRRIMWRPLAIIAVVGLVFATMANAPLASAETGFVITRSGSSATAGGPGGGAFGETNCPQGTIATGIRGGYSVGDSYIGSYQFKCSTVNPDTGAIQNPVSYTSPAQGAADTSITTVSCPSGQAMVGLHIYVTGSNVIQNTYPRCQTLSIVDGFAQFSGSVTELSTAVSPTGGQNNAGLVACPAGQAMLGFEGRSGGGLDQITAYCGSLAQASLTATVSTPGSAMGSAAFSPSTSRSGGTTNALVVNNATPVIPGMYTTSLGLATGGRSEWFSTSSSGSCTNAALANQSTYTCAFSVVSYPDVDAGGSAPASLPKGGEGSLVASAKNVGPAASASTITVTKAAGVTYGTLPASCSDAGTTIVCTTASLSGSATVGAAGGSASFSIPFEIDESNAGPVVHSISSSTADDGYAANDGAVTSTTVGGPESDLATTVSDPGPATPGNNAIVDLTVDNGGPSNADNTTVAYTPPASVSVRMGEIDGSCTANQPAAGSVRCSLGTVADGGSKSVSVPVVIDADAAPNTVVSADSAAGASSDSTDSDGDLVAAPLTLGPASADLAVSQTGQLTLMPEASGALAFRVDNAGPSQAGTGSFAYELPASVEFDSGAANPNNCVVAAGIATCAWSSPITVGGNTTVTLPITMLLVQPISTSPPTVDALLTDLSTPDPSSTNNVAAVAITLDLSGDSDSDGASDGDEIDPSATGTPLDTDRDGDPDYLDTDSDDDGIDDSIETDGGDVTVNTDGDRLADYRDLDSDGDGVSDEVESNAGSELDVDSDGDGTPDWRDPLGSTISGVAFRDSNRNGRRDGTEVAIDDIKVRLMRSGTDGKFGTADDVQYRAAVTDGSYSFTDIDPGPYQLIATKASVPKGMYPTGDTSFARSIDLSSSDLRINFGFNYAKVSGVLTNGAGQPLGGVEVTVTDSSGRKFTTVTASDGSYVVEGTATAPLALGTATISGVDADGNSFTKTVELTETTTPTADVVSAPARAWSVPLSLAFTGPSSGLPAVLALLLLALGTIARQASRRSRGARR